VSKFLIREGRDEDRPYCARFIDALQALEHPLTQDRRLDDTIGIEYHDKLIEKARANQGKVYVAEAGGKPIGWTVAYLEEQQIFVEEHLRKFGYISELYVEPAWHGSGVGQALIAAAEAHLKSTGVKYALIGVLAGNDRAEAAYKKAGYSPYALDLRKRL
jgi:GNAT superfamily N-acetyltransferase